MTLLFSSIWRYFRPFPSIWLNFTSHRALHTAKSAKAYLTVHGTLTNKLKYFRIHQDVRFYNLHNTVEHDSAVCMATGSQTPQCHRKILFSWLRPRYMMHTAESDSVLSDSTVWCTLRIQTLRYLTPRYDAHCGFRLRGIWLHGMMHTADSDSEVADSMVWCTLRIQTPGYLTLWYLTPWYDVHCRVRLRGIWLHGMMYTC